MGDRQGSQSPARSQRTIIEQDGEESEVSAMNIVTAHHKEAITKREIQEKTDVINQYKRIDTVTMQRVGLKQK